jgi:hypothetical protein
MTTKEKIKNVDDIDNGDYIDYGNYIDGIYHLFITSPSMPLTGLSLDMYIFHFEAISLSTHISGSKRPIFTNLDSLERLWHVDGPWRNLSPKKNY